MRLFSYLKRHAGQVILIALLLVAQAFCDLTLPAYISDIVDVGIQQGGIESAVPDKMRAQTMAALRERMTDEEVALLDSSYAAQGGAYALKPGADADKLSEMLALPMAAASLNLSRAQADAALPGDEAMLSQRAIAFVRAEYQALGVDLQALETRYLLITGGKMLLLTLLMGAAAALAGLVASRTAASVGMELRRRVFAKVLTFTGAELDRFSSASLITRSTNDIQQVQAVMVMLLRMAMYAPIVGIGGILRVAGTNTGLSWIIAVAVGVVGGIVIALTLLTTPKFKRMQALIDRLNLVSREILTGIPVIRAFRREAHEEARFDSASRDLMQTQLFTSRAMSMMMPAMMLVMNGVVVAIMWFAAKGIDMGRLQVGDMMAFINYTMQIIMAFMMLTMMSIMLPRASVAAGRIDEVLSTTPMITDPADARRAPARRGVVEFHDVSLRFPGADDDALSHVSFTAMPGQVTAVIGSTGSGKSTLINLIPRFYDVTGGSVTVDGVDVRDMPQKALREMIGYAPQKAVLFSGTIESNIKLAGEAVDDSAMRGAARVAQAEPFIASRPDGYQSAIAQGGTNVSGGQRQRLSIARAVAARPPILLFDDSFSALDYKTDAALRKALRDSAKDATVILVAQRISTVLNADQIIVLDDGRVAGIGDHRALMSACESYREIARSQLSDAELGEKGGAPA